MSTGNTRECPYCNAVITYKVEVCMHCGREVKKIYELQERLDKAVQKLKDLGYDEEVADVKPINKSLNVKISMLQFCLYYLLIATLLNILMMFYGYDLGTQVFKAIYYQVAISILIIISSWIGIKYVYDFSFWIFLFFVFVQQFIYFYIISIPIKIFEFKDTNDPIIANLDIINGTWQSIILFCGVFLISSITFNSFLNKGSLQIYSLKMVWDTKNGMSEIVKIVIAIGGAVPSILLIFHYLQELLKFKV